MSIDPKDLPKVVKADVVEQSAEPASEGEAKPTAIKAAKKPRKNRSAKYSAVRAHVDKTRKYDPFSAIEMIKKLSYSSFPGTITAHGVVESAGEVGSVALPHNTGKTYTVAVFSEEVAKQIEDGNIDFDVLLATPADMPKLTKFARSLGPKGLMPNPKNGTLTQDIEGKKKQLSSGTVTIKTEKKAPLYHVVIGKTDMETKDLVENLTALLTATKTKTRKLSIAATMSPGIKVELAK